MTEKKEAVETVSRRGMLRAVGLGAGTAGLAAAGLAAGAAQAGAVPGTKANSRDVAGYRETEHVKTYYALARL